ncbi:hypothetical protein KDA_71050 [Dictyobacter alpinus]|uniref:Uncharacterized protein n=1 Tax=Dictyobacter alpinus TaxID=2014873 RepID=A0A402BJU1_9CHLR|nr:hypothetical protein [Dictyobacter alpinus]GCE31621.1 hypothetical protein KDA_71050 [Dictyobacter alpinus]
MKIGRRLAIGDDKKTQVWKTATGRNILTYQGHTNIVEGLDWSPQGKYITSGSKDLTFHIWEARTGKLVFAAPKSKSSFEGVLWSLDGTMVAAATDAEGVMIWQSPR